MRAALAAAWRLIAVFGIYGLALWPALGWLGHDLLVTEWEMLDGLRVNASTILGRDFVNVWHAGGEALVDGTTVYDRTAYRETLYEAAGVLGIYAFSYPPHALLLAIPFGVPPYPVALALWTLVGLTLFAIAARPWLRDAGLPLWSVLVLPAGLVNLWAGHFGWLIGALALFGWRHAGRAPLGAGLSFALMSVKPHMGLLVPVVLAVRRDWRTVAAAAAGVLLLVALSAILFGVDTWQTWFTSTLVFQAGLIEPVATRQYSFMMPTAATMLLALTTEPGRVIAGQIGFAAAAAALLLWAARRGGSTADLGLLSLAATPLILPYSFTYDMVALSLAALIWAARSPARWWSPERLVYAAAFVAPLAHYPLAREGWWPTPLVVLAALIVAAWRTGR